MAGQMPASMLAQMIRGAKPLVPAAHMVTGAVEQHGPPTAPQRRPGVYPTGGGYADVVGTDGRIQPVEENRLYTEPDVAALAREMILGGRPQHVGDAETQQLAQLQRARALATDPTTGETRIVANVPGGGKEAFPLEFDEETGQMRLGSAPSLMGRLAALIRGEL